MALSPHDYADGGVQEQVPIAEDDCPITKTRLLTRTHYEINVVSTVYRTRTHTEHSQATKTAENEPPSHTMVFGVEGWGCDPKACAICRLLNNCSNEEPGCPNCDHAYYCNQCEPREQPTHINMLPGGSGKICSLGPGRSIPCDAVEQAEALGYKVFEFGH